MTTKLVAEDCIQTAEDNWLLYCPARLASAFKEVLRLARLGAGLEASQSKWRHYKGNVYTLLTPAIRESDGTEEVVYQAQETEDQQPVVYVRPKKEWEEVLGDDEEGTRFFRFEKIED
jgi:hypothetical protein